MKKLVIECPECRGTGLYSGLMERTGEAVVCVRCGGVGGREFKYEEFTGRKKKDGIQKVRGGSGMIFDDPSKAKWVSYSEFERMIPPNKVSSSS